MHKNFLDVQKVFTSPPLLVFTVVLHIVVEIVNAINFIKNYDQEHEEINWAKGQNDVS